jgi:WD40 repeat protein
LVFYYYVKRLYAGMGKFDDLNKPGRVVQWDFSARKRLPDLATIKGAVLALAASADRVAVGGSDRTVTLCDPAGVTPPVTLSGHTVAIRGLAFLPDGRLLSAGGVTSQPREVGEIKLWDLATAREVPPLFGQRAGVAAVAASADGSIVATAGWDEIVRVWRFSKGK